MHKTGEKWSAEDTAFLRANYNTMSMPDLMTNLGRGQIAIHRRASKQKIAGNRYSVNNFLAGKGYSAPKVENLRGNLGAIAAKKNNSVTACKNTGALKSPKKGQNNDPETWREKRERKEAQKEAQKFKIRPFNSAGKRLHRIDSKTSIYLPIEATNEEIERIINQYKKAPN